MAAEKRLGRGVLPGRPSSTPCSAPSHLPDPAAARHPYCEGLHCLRGARPTAAPQPPCCPDGPALLADPSRGHSPQTLSLPRGSSSRTVSRLRSLPGPPLPPALTPAAGDCEPPAHGPVAATSGSGPGGR